ncbi:MAG: response regulator transcription factor, partial [Chloroflexaceae bacterium]
AEVIKGMARGQANQKIADRLGLRVKTVETYRARAMDKLGLANRAALVRYALEKGWLGEG